MKKIISFTAIIIFCFIDVGFCADNFFVIPVKNDIVCIGDASVDDVLMNKTFSGNDGNGLAGNMPDVGQQNITPGTADQIINEGYHDGTGQVLGDVDLIAKNIKYGIQIFDVSGTAGVITGCSSTPWLGTVIDNCNVRCEMKYLPSYPNTNNACKNICNALTSLRIFADFEGYPEDS